MALRCCDTATALSHELLLLNKFAVGGFRKTISKASLKIWKGRKIEHLKRDLDGYQKALDSKLIIDVRHVYQGCRVEPMLTRSIQGESGDSKSRAAGRSHKFATAAFSVISKSGGLSFADIEPSQVGNRRGHQHHQGTTCEYEATCQV